MFRLLILAGTLWLGAAVPFTDRTKTDFDTFLQLLNPYGKWVKIEKLYLYEPFEAYTPMTDGEWIYSDFGWYWNGKRPFSWATDHYGVWRLGEDKVWRWKPDPDWQAAKAEWRGTEEFIGWRSTPMDRFGEITEPETSRYARPEEWVFIPRAKLAKTIRPADVLPAAQAKEVLEKSEAINHTYVTWREIDRHGPDPFDVYGVAKSFLVEQTMAKPEVVKDLSGGGEDAAPIIVAAPGGGPVGGNPAKADADKEKKPPIYTILSLPNFYYVVKPNPLKPLDFYVYRPEFFQDIDGVQRRVEVWLNPPTRRATREKVGRLLESTGGPIIYDGSQPTPNAPVPSSTTNSVPPSPAQTNSVTPPEPSVSSNTLSPALRTKR